MSEEPANCIFQRRWWLDAVAPGQWQEVTVNKGGELKARLPFVIRRSSRLRLRHLVMPPLTQTLGPWIARLEGKYGNRLAQQKDLFTALIEALPPHDYFDQNFHYSITNWLSFRWHGFQQTTNYTYVIDDISDPERVWDDFLDRVRTDVQKAKRRLVVRDDLAIDRLLDIVEMTFTRQGQPSPYDRDLIRQIHKACVDRKACLPLFAEDAEGQVHAAVYIIWDEHSAYYLLSGGDPRFRNSGAGSLLVWHALQRAARHTTCFDFEGSMIEPIERFVRGFGARQKPYFRITRTSPRMRRLLAARELIQAFRPQSRS